MENMQSYDRAAAVAYAHRWAYGRNPRYYDFSALGGDCTNFASQCLLAGVGGVMNHTPNLGWYYYSATRRAPSWTAAAYFANYLIRESRSPGPFAQLAPLEEAEAGDFIQLKFMNLPDFSHTLVVVKKGSAGDPGSTLVAAHSIDSDLRRVDSYFYQHLRVLHILGAYRSIQGR